MKKKQLFLIFVLLAGIGQTVAQEYIPIDPELTQKQDISVNKQAETSLNLANKVLLNVPPQIPEPLERILALSLCLM